MKPLSNYHICVALTLGVLIGTTTISDAQTVDLINLTFSPTNAGDTAAHPNVSNISSWINGSELPPDPFGSGLYYMPGNDFGNGYAGLTVNPTQFGFKWGFEGGFDLNSSVPLQVSKISFDYDVFGHNGEASLSLAVGAWSGSAPLPSTGSDWDLPTDTFTPVGVAERSYGTVTFDFLNNTLTVSRTGVNFSTHTLSTYAAYSTGFTGNLSLTNGTQAIDILTTNTKPLSDGAFDANAGSTQSDPGFYRIDNFRIEAAAVPEPSFAMVLFTSGALIALRRKK